VSGPRCPGWISRAFSREAVLYGRHGPPRRRLNLSHGEHSGPREGQPSATPAQPPSFQPMIGEARKARWLLVVNDHLSLLAEHPVELAEVVWVLRTPRHLRCTNLQIAENHGRTCTLSAPGAGSTH
jgi:hypothetical protein